jgi:hypothetical protein
MEHRVPASNPFCPTEQRQLPLAQIRVEAYLERQHVDRRKIERRSGSGGFAISRRTTDRRSVDRGSVEKLTV